MKQAYHGQHGPAASASARPKRQRFVALLTALGLTFGTAQAQQRPTSSFFQADAAARTAAVASPLAATLVRSQALTLDAPGLRAALATAPPESRAGAAPLVLALPQPDGRSARFALREAPIMEPALAAKFPQIKTYAGVGLDDATATVRVDLTPRGFHAQVLSSTGAGFDIDPVSPADVQHCLSYYRQDVKPTATGQAFRCGSEATSAQEKAGAAQVAAWRAGGGGTQARATGAQLRTYRLALACTPEYALTKGNTKLSVLAAEVVTINRVVGTYERELALRLVLVANNDQITFLSGTGTQPRKPYINRSVDSLQVQNQPNVDFVIGKPNYDIGFVFGTPREGGIAAVGGLCNYNQKAEGAADDILYIVRHEIGHMFGALHSFNTISGGRNDLSAWEPGSGVTIMGYAGLFGPSDDAQPNVEDVFHTGSFESIQAFIGSRSCGTSTATGNTPPVVTVPASGKTLPANTPFKLTATATDANNDPLTYSWEEIDRGPAGNLTMAQVTGQTPPLFRFWLPVTSGTRYFPRLNELVNNTAALGERLPTVSRKLRFRCTARDLHNGTAGVVGGITSSDSVNLLVSAAAGPFVVTAPNAAGTSWAGGSTQTVTWDVANTNTAPVSCAKVNLLLSLDGGLTYPTVLSSNVNNSGSASITVPNAPTTTARIMVEAADNYFFDISNTNFAITTSPAPAIVSFTPASGPVGTVVTLTGTGLMGATAVSFNGTAATNVTVVSATSLTATVAAGTNSGPISVTTPAGTATSATPFTVLAPPAFTSFTPASGPVGTVVTLTGTNLSGTTAVNVNGTAAASFAVVSATSLTATVAAGTGSGPISVTTPAGTATSATPFTVLAPPAITALSPANGPVGTAVMVTGTDLGGTTRLTLNGAAVVGFAVVNATSVTFTVPAGATSGPVVATTPSGVSNATRVFTVTSVSGTGGTNATVFSVWPNPVGTQGVLHVRLAEPATSARARLRNGQGQVVVSRIFSGSTVELSTAGLASGLYMLNVQAVGHTTTMLRVVVE